MAGVEQLEVIDLPETCTEVEVTVRETTRTTSLLQSPTSSSSFDQSPTNILQNGGQSEESLCPPRHLMVYDPPPPYPGPPSNVLPSCHPTVGQQHYRHELRDSVTNEPLFAFNRYGQMIPAQQVTAVNRQSPLVQNIPGQIVIEESTPAATRRIQTTRVITDQARDHSRHAVSVRTRQSHTRHSQRNNYHLKLSLLLLVFCGIQGNLPALFCTAAAVAYSLKTRRLISQRQFNKARQTSLYVVLCNAIAVIEYTVILIAAVVLVLIYLLGDSVIN